MSRCCSFICLCTLSGGHCDTVWYVQSYKQLALNSICKINSPRAGAAHIRLLPSSRPRFLPPFLVCLSSCSFSNSPFQSALCSVLPLLHSSDSISTPPPIHLQDITDLTGHFVLIDAVARGPAGGRRHLGTRSAPTGQRLGFGVMGVVGTILRERACVGVLISVLISLGQFLPGLPPCRSVTLLLPAVTKPLSV